MNDKFRDIKDQATDKMNNVKEGVNSATERIMQIPGEAALAATNTAKDISNTVSAATTEKVRQWVEDFNTAVPAMKALGFAVKKFSFNIGVIPEMNATLIGSVEALNPQKFQELREHTTNKALQALLGALLTTTVLKQQLTAVGLRAVEVEIKLGLPPLIKVNLLTDTGIKLSA